MVNGSVTRMALARTLRGHDGGRATRHSSPLPRPTRRHVTDTRKVGHRPPRDGANLEQKRSIIREVFDEISVLQTSAMTPRRRYWDGRRIRAIPRA